MRDKRIWSAKKDVWAKKPFVQGPYTVSRDSKHPCVSQKRFLWLFVPLTSCFLSFPSVYSTVLIVLRGVSSARFFHIWWGWVNRNVCMSKRIWSTFTSEMVFGKLRTTFQRHCEQEVWNTSERWVCSHEATSRLVVLLGARWFVFSFTKQSHKQLSF